MVSKYIYMRKMLTFIEVLEVLLPFVATFPAQNNLSLVDPRRDKTDKIQLFQWKNSF